MIWSDTVTHLTNENHGRNVVTVYFGKAAARLHLDLRRNHAMARQSFPMKNFANVIPIIVSIQGPPVPFYMIRLSSNYNSEHIKFFCFHLGSR
jgi:hypothetical protein